jgi:hypothetical protein
MKHTCMTLAILGVSLMILPIPNIDEVEWFSPDVAREIAKFHDAMNSDPIQQAPRDFFLRFRNVGEGFQKIVNDQPDR